MARAIPKTVVHELNAQADRLQDRPALWTKRGGKWVATSWREYAQKVKLFALGLLQLGLSRQSPVAILGFNREEWVVADLAAMAAGGVPVGLYQTLSPEQLRYVLDHSQASVCVVEDDQALARVLAVREGLTALKHLIVMEPAQPLPEGVHSFAEVLDKGGRADDAEYFARLEAARPEDLATLIYTSGTTGHPKGVMLSHQNVCWTAVTLSEAMGLERRREEETLLSYLPLSHIAEQVCSIYGPIFNALEVSFAESFEKLPEDLREVRPTLFFGVPRVWEKFKTKVEQGIAAQPLARRRLVGWARDVALRFHKTNLQGRPVSITLQAEFELAKRLVFKGLKARIGLDRTHLFATSAAPISKEVLDFFASLDVVIREVYGQSEVTGPTSVNTPDATRLGTLGRPMRGVEVRLADDQEILVRGPNVCLGYYREAEATAELISGGWLHSGDTGAFDADGYLQIIGRKKEILVTSGGKKTAPAAIELMLKGIDPVGNALVIGDRRSHLVALLAIDPERAKAFAVARGLPMDPKQLAAHPDFKSYLAQRIEADVNPRLARFETIKRFEVLPQDFTVEGGELTPTLKVRRKVCEQKYAAVIDALYADAAAKAS